MIPRWPDSRGSTTGLSLGSPRRWRGAAGGAPGRRRRAWPSRGRHGPKNQQGTLAAASPPLARLPERRTASVRWCSRVLGSRATRVRSPARPTWLTLGGPNSARVDQFLLRARRWLNSGPWKQRTASCCLWRPRRSTELAPREGISAGLWQLDRLRKGCDTSENGGGPPRAPRKPK